MNSLNESKDENKEENQTKYKPDLHNINSDYFLQKLFNICKKSHSLQIFKYNKKLQKKKMMNDKKQKEENNSNKYNKIFNNYRKLEKEIKNLNITNKIKKEEKKIMKFEENNLKEISNG